MTQYNELTPNSGLYPQPGQLLVLPAGVAPINLYWPYQNMPSSGYAMSSVIMSTDTTTVGGGILTVKLPLAANGSVPGVFNCYNRGVTTINFLGDDGNVVLTLAPQNNQANLSNNGQLVLVSDQDNGVNYWYGFNLNGVPVNNSVPNFLAGPGLRPYEITQLVTYPMFNASGATPSTVIFPKDTTASAPLNVVVTSAFPSQPPAQSPQIKANFSNTTDPDSITITYVTSDTGSNPVTVTMTSTSNNPYNIPSCTGIYKITGVTPSGNAGDVNISGTVQNYQALTSLAVSPTINIITAGQISGGYADRDTVFILPANATAGTTYTLPSFVDAPSQTAAFLNGFTVSFINNAVGDNKIIINPSAGQTLQAKNGAITLTPNDISSSLSVTLVFYSPDQSTVSTGAWYVLSSNGVTDI